MCSNCSGDYEDPEEFSDEEIDVLIEKLRVFDITKHDGRKLLTKLVDDDIAEQMAQGEKDARFEDLLERCWFNLNGWEYVEARSKQSGQ